MLKESIETTLDPASLTDDELIRFAEEFLHSNILGMTRKFQAELLKRFTEKTI